MSSLRRTLAVLAVLALGTLGARAGSPAVTRPIVVELYTSQGCSSCPPADALLGRLAQRPGVIAISLPITYWDMLGWKDTLASDANTRRQKAYAAAMGHGGVYTPQIIVDGAVDVVGSRVVNVETAIAMRQTQLAQYQGLVVARADMARYARDAIRAQADAARAQQDGLRAAEAAGAPHAVAASVPLPPLAPSPPLPPLPRGVDPVVPVMLRETPQEIHIDIGAVSGVPNATVWLLSLRGAVSVKIPSGENTGRTITYHNVASDLKAVGVYKGRALNLVLPRSAVPHDGIAVIVQQDGYGHIVGAAYVSRTNYFAQQ